MLTKIVDKKKKVDQSIAKNDLANPIKTGAVQDGIKYEHTYTRILYIKISKDKK